MSRAAELDPARAMAPRARGRSAMASLPMPSNGEVLGEWMMPRSSWLYDRDEAWPRGARRGAQRGLGLLTRARLDRRASTSLFPKETIERLERDAVERYRIDEVVTNPEVLARVEPDQALLEAVLRTKHLMRPDVLSMARRLIEAVVRKLMERLATEVRAAFSGALDRRRRSNFKMARNLDFRRTLAKSLGRWSPSTKKLYLERPLFFSRTRRHAERWQIILVADQSGSMVSSVIHTAITAACLWNLPGMTTHLVAFDTNVVHLTRDVVDPVELLMKVQLGGGTDIAKAMQYASELVEAPRRAIVVLVTDFFEGGSPERLVRIVAALTAQGTRVLGLAALDERANPIFDRELARRLVEAGAQVGAMTPGELAAWIAEKVRA